MKVKLRYEKKEGEFGTGENASDYTINVSNFASIGINDGNDGDVDDIVINTDFKSKPKGMRHGTQVNSFKIILPKRQAMELAIAILRICEFKAVDKKLPDICIEINEYDLPYHVEKGITASRLAQFLGTDEDEILNEIRNNISVPNNLKRLVSDFDLKYRNSFFSGDIRLNSLRNLDVKSHEEICNYIQNKVDDIENELIRTAFIPKKRVDEIQIKLLKKTEEKSSKSK
jgi:hypothetical protein